MNSIEIVKDYVRGWIRHDSSKILKHFGRDGVYIDPLVDRELLRNEINDHSRLYFQLFPDLSFEGVGEIVCNEKLISAQWIMRGTFTSCDSPTLSTPLRIEIPGSDFVFVKDGKIRSVQAYFDHRKVPKEVDLAFRNGMESADSPGSSQLSPDHPAKKYVKSALSAQKSSEIAVKLKRHMTENMIYRESELSLSKLAELLHCTNNHVSQVINSEFAMNFYDFVNQYRIREAQTILRNHDPSKMSILDIALSVGFNSKSTFNAAFKKQTELTPSQYIQIHAK